jgi:hypothetical protein
MTQKVWYASYGSNLSYRNRFLCYIVGGRPAGAKRWNPGCRDKTPPSDIQPIPLNCELYFASYSDSWGGSPAFIRRGSRRSLTHGRAYLITDEQFNDVVMQENGGEPDGTRIVPPFEQLSRMDTYILPSNPLYGLLWRVGNEGGSPVITFTTARNNLAIGSPSEPYVQIIAAGLKETYPKMTDIDIARYLHQAEGVRNRIPEKQLLAWVRAALRGS